jgi:reversibly glycosylated polypeptide/UDP-arabinopyranose mutase
LRLLGFWLLQVGEKLNGIDPYFTKLAEAMVTWIEAWTEISAAHKKEAEAVSNGK